MQLLIAVVNQDEKLDDILSGFLELGITGATVIRSEGMGRVLSHDIPIFAGLQTLLARDRAMVGMRELLSREVVHRVGDTLREAAAVHEDERRAMRLDELHQPRMDRRPDRCAHRWRVPAGRGRRGARRAGISGHHRQDHPGSLAQDPQP